MADTPLEIDIVSDVMCPWCVVGYHQLKAALDEKGISTEIRWHPFELNPQMPEDGQNLREHLMEKYGISAEDSDANRKRLTDIGEDLGFAFHFTDDTRMQNTFLAHQLIHWAGLHGRAHDMKLALFGAHFTDGRAVGQVETLADIAGEIGLDRDEALAVLTDQRFASDVRSAQKFWIDAGISGVPAIIFNRQHLVSGAQGTDRFGQILDALTQAE
ncbi:DsbA family oxidoreductase [Rhodospirillaceae bacterium KN72]|uniref:DsbA family oxidoreductase n=1 Tax=Pacificispira spongiicola TaxID=2729598 RepID=A0A7Y0E4U1_9PROT|nr:DsbA family oxidoreductase [Pacificispira spongiicola]NMM46396.1 DsbA family oxidoreductase [Pacificispira spongiicola]